MKSSVRQHGIDIISPALWGTHICMFYQTKGDLLDILIPYFKEGLENNEYCIWVTSEPLNEKDAEKAMRAAIPNFDRYLQKNQIEIIPYTEGYGENNEFNSQRVLNGWVDKCNYALDNGFKGLRLTGNTYWLEDKDWKDFTDYEEEVNNVISSYNIIAVCTYSLEKCRSFEILDIVRNHQYVLFRREGSWERFKSSGQTLIEQRLKESEEKYRTLFESSKDGIIFSNMEGKIMDCNQAYLDMLGYTLVEIKEFSYQQLTPEKWHEMETDIFNNRLLPRGFSGEFEKEYIRKDGTTVPISIATWLIKDDQGNNKGMWAIIRDISERKKADEALKASELMLQKSQIIGQIGSFEMDLTTNEVVWSNQLYKLFGLKKEGRSIDYEKVLALIHPDDRERAIKVSSNAAKEKKPYTLEHRVIHPDGRTLDLLVTGDVIRNENNEIVKIGGTTQDITERKKRKKEIFDLAQFPSEDPYPVLRVNRDGVMYINEAGQELLNIVDYSQIPNFLQENVKNTFESNQITESEAEFDNRMYSFIITPVKDQNYVNIYGMDITERKHVEDKLKEINRLKSEFLRRASHELKTPLISIKGFSDLILSLYTDQLDTPIISKLNEINDGCERLQNIINNLLHTSKLESTELKPKLEREDLSFLINFCVDELQPLTAKREHSLNIEIQDSIITRFEKEEIHDVISNLLTNAIKYTPPKGWIDIKTETIENFVVVSISDNGIGFTEEEKGKIFQQFGKIERYGQGLDLGIDGTGLGLYISKRIVESHGGKIWMESEGKDKGSTFYFSLPLIGD